MLGPKIVLGPNNLGGKFFWFKNFWVQKDFWVQKIFRAQKNNLGLKNFCVKKNFWAQKIVGLKILGLKNGWV